MLFISRFYLRNKKKNKYTRFILIHQTKTNSVPMKYRDHWSESHDTLQENRLVGTDLATDSEPSPTLKIKDGFLVSRL